jgi:hypothetical protein
MSRRTFKMLNEPRASERQWHAKNIKTAFAFCILHTLQLGLHESESLAPAVMCVRSGEDLVVGI